NVVLITDRRTYLIEAVSQAGNAYAAQVAWSYPQNAAAQTGAIPSIDRLNFSYRVRTVRGRTPIWTPARVFDDGRRTWIEFPPGVAATDMPPLFVITGEGAEIANYRVQGQRMIVDRLFDRAELRLGVRAPIIVRIDREGVRR
ncbi:MAG TPA: TrbG/VirB9 family P-type conjugative transfer protein, partial [Hyphomicrobiaceae bacterium]|nr:TrbG/VirB9 family P-type conjugative transfer protein [Hyphomicrobiaceae bacterium]